MAESRDNLPAQTHHRLLEAAGETFAARGFRQATVREICERADANVAAVNYHFGDKVGLYVAALQHWFAAALEKYPPDGGLPPDAPAEQRLRGFVRNWLFRMMGDGAPAWHGRLMAREMADPTPGVFDALIESHIRPHAMLLHAIVRELLGPGVPPRVVGLCATSIAGQCMFHFHCRDTIQKVMPVVRAEQGQLDALADHITAFSLAAVRSFRATHDGSPMPRNGQARVLSNRKRTKRRRAKEQQA